MLAPTNFPKVIDKAKKQQVRLQIALFLWIL